MLWIGIGLLVAAAGWWIYRTQSTYHLATVETGKLYRCGLQSFGEFENAIRKVRPKTLVTLVDDREVADPEKPQFRREIDTFADPARGVSVVRVAIPLGGWPEGDQVERFLAVATDPQRQPVMVHCAQGVRRTGMMAAAYQMSVLGYDKERAKREMLTFGHSRRTVGDIERFIDAYDPQSRRMTATLPQSKE